MSNLSESPLSVPQASLSAADVERIVKPGERKLEFLDVHWMIMEISVGNILARGATGRAVGVAFFRPCAWFLAAIVPSMGISGTCACARENEDWLRKRAGRDAQDSNKENYSTIVA